MQRLRVESFRHLSLLVAVVVLLKALSLNGQEFDASGLLFVCQDESTIEENIAAYIEAKHGVQARRSFSGPNKDDLVLTYTISPGGDTPELKVLVDTMISGRAREGGEVKSRMVKIFSFYKSDAVRSNESLRTEVLKLNDQFMKERWLPHRLYLDKDNDIVMESCINIVGADTPIHAEMVHDTLARLVGSWKEYYSRLSKLLSQHSRRGNEDLM